MKRYGKAIIGNGLTARTRRGDVPRLSPLAHDAIKAGAKTAAKLKRDVHICATDNQGLCHFCGVVMNEDWLAGKGAK